jgi:hypothetical protein
MLLWAINQDWAENLFLFGKAYLRRWCVLQATRRGLAHENFSSSLRQRV